MRYLIPALLLFAFPALAQEQETFAIGGFSYTIEIKPEHPDGYNRNDWPHWNPRVGGGCFSVRDKVLAEESFAPVTTVPASGGRCRVTHGLWTGPYTGKTFTNADQVQIDHVVPLKEAHNSGGHAWDEERRRAYANDLSYPHHLIAVDGPENGTVKKDKDPADYLPREAFRCAYIEARIRIKHRWGLSMDRREADAVRAVVEGCG